MKGVLILVATCTAKPKSEASNSLSRKFPYNTVRNTDGLSICIRTVLIRSTINNKIHTDTLEGWTSILGDSACATSTSRSRQRNVFLTCFKPGILTS